MIKINKTPIVIQTYLITEYKILIVYLIIHEFISLKLKKLQTKTVLTTS